MRKHMLALALFIGLTFVFVIGNSDFGDSDGQTDLTATGQEEAPHTIVTTPVLSPREADHLPDNVVALTGGRNMDWEPDGQYQGVDNCFCHGDKQDSWEMTVHGQDFSDYDYHGEQINKFTRSGGYCQKCHTVGYGNDAWGGFNSSEAWNSTTEVGNQEVPNADLLGIQCENCHGPGEEHMDNSGDRAAYIWGNPTAEQSCYGDGSTCHGDHQYPAWNESLHSPQDQIAAENPRGLDSYCARCKSPTQWDPEAERGEHEFNATEWKGIDCASCHDLHPDDDEEPNEHLLRQTVEEACTVCHTADKANDIPTPNGDYGDGPASAHHNQRETLMGILGVDVFAYSGMAGVTCVDCHMYNTPAVSRQPITNWVEGEESHGHSMEPSAWACADCHSNIMATMPTLPYGTDDDVNASWDAWEPQWIKEVNKWEHTVEGWQEDWERIYEHVEHNIEAAGENLSEAYAAGEIDMAIIDEANQLYGEAVWNHHMTDDGSSGAHNPDYFMALLTDANTRALRAIYILQNAEIPEVMDFPPMADAGDTILIELTGVANFDASKSYSMDGTNLTYAWDFDDGSGPGAGITTTHTYDEVGIYEVTLTVTDEDSETATDMVTVYVIESFEAVPADLAELEGDVEDLDTALQAILDGNLTVLDALAASLGVSVADLETSLAATDAQVDALVTAQQLADAAIGVLQADVEAQEDLNEAQSQDIEDASGGDDEGASTGMFVLVLLLALVALAAVGGSFMMLKEEIDGLKGGAPSRSYDSPASRDEPKDDDEEDN